MTPENEQKFDRSIELGRASEFQYLIDQAKSLYKEFEWHRSERTGQWRDTEFGDALAARFSELADCLDVTTEYRHFLRYHYRLQIGSDLQMFIFQEEENFFGLYVGEVNIAEGKFGIFSDSKDVRSAIEERNITIMLKLYVEVQYDLRHHDDSREMIAAAAKRESLKDSDFILWSKEFEQKYGCTPNVDFGQAQ